MAKAKQPQLPKGFKPARVEAAGFYERKAGNILQGVMLGNFEIDGNFGRKKVFRFRVTEGETAITNKDGADVAKPGDVVLIDKTGWLSCLDDYGDGEELYILCEGKDGTGRQDPWKFQIGVRE